MAKNILIVVEGEKQDLKLIEFLSDMYFPDEDISVVVYQTNIYELYHRLFDEDDEHFLDFIQVLKEKEHDSSNRKILERKYTDILLVFDFDPQDSLFSLEKLERLQDYFDESTDSGMLYINYPMVESFRHIKMINEPAQEFFLRTVSLNELREHKYKERVNRESCIKRYDEFKKSTVNGLIKRHLEKVGYLLKRDTAGSADDLKSILKIEADLLDQEQKVSVLNTSVLFVYAYNRLLIE